MALNILLLDVIHQWRQGVSVWIDWRMEQFKRVGALVIGIAVLVNRRLGIEPVSNLAQKRIKIL